MSESKRRDARHVVQIALRLTVRRATYTVVTEDVSFRGLFVRTDETIGARQLVPIEIDLPDGMLKVHGMAVWVIGKDNPGGRVPGVGLQFYGLGREENGRWQRFVRGLRESEVRAAEEANAQADGAASAGLAVEPIRRTHPRFSAAFLVRAKNRDTLLALYTRDISAGGMFLLTAEPVAIGATIALELVHPDAKQVFELSAVVRRTARAPEPSGLGLEFPELDEARRKALFHFILSGVSSEPATMIEPGDPQLA